MLYSDSNTYTAGDTLILRILDSSDISPGDGLAIVYGKEDTDSCNRPGAVFINTYGELSQYNDGHFKCCLFKAKVMILTGRM